MPVLISSRGLFFPLRQVEYGRLRGIRVIAELDTPGHSGSWYPSHPEVSTYCGGDSALLNPTLNATYTLLRPVMGEVATLFPDQYRYFCTQCCAELLSRSLLLT